MVYWKRLITLQLIVWFAWNFCEAAKYDSNYAWMWVIKVYKNPRWWTTAILEIVNLSPVHLVGILGTVLPFKSCFYLLRGFGAVGGQKSPPPIIMAVGLYDILYYYLWSHCSRTTDGLGGGVHSLRSFWCVCVSDSYCWVNRDSTNYHEKNSLSCCVFCRDVI